MRAFLTISATALLLAAPAAQASELFRADLEGGQEVPAVDTPTSGEAIFRLSDDEATLGYTIRIRDGVDITQAHIHCAPAGVNGPVVAFLAGFNSAGYNVDGKWLSNVELDDTNIVNPACGATIAELAESMRAGGTYVNVHTNDVPSGEIRGQIEPAE